MRSWRCSKARGRTGRQLSRRLDDLRRRRRARDAVEGGRVGARVVGLGEVSVVGRLVQDDGREVADGLRAELGVSLMRTRRTEEDGEDAQSGSGGARA